MAIAIIFCDHSGYGHCMPLEPCKACQSMISTSAKQCPQCGHPNPRTNPHSKANRIKTGVGFLVTGGIACLFGFFLYSGGSAREQLNTIVLCATLGPMLILGGLVALLGGLLAKE